MIIPHPRRFQFRRQAISIGAFIKTNGLSLWVQSERPQERSLDAHQIFCSQSLEDYLCAELHRARIARCRDLSPKLCCRDVQVEMVSEVRVVEDIEHLTRNWSKPTR